MGHPIFVQQQAARDLERNQDSCVLLSLVLGRRPLDPSDEPPLPAQPTKLTIMAMQTAIFNVMSDFDSNSFMSVLRFSCE